jgi:hypothetical protein
MARRGGVRRRHGDTALRVVAAVPGGYAVASLGAMAMARLLPWDRLQASVAAAILAFGLCALAAMWAFAARSGWRALWTVLVACAAAGMIAFGSIRGLGRA